MSAFAVALALAAASVFLVTAPASAHDDLDSTDPAADSTVEALPAQLTLTFSGVLATDPGATVLQVTDAAGASLADGDPVVAETTVTQALEGEASGVVHVLWKVVSSDGHPISGEYSFAVAAPAPTATAPTSTASPSATPVEEPTATATPPPPADGDTSAGSAWPWIIGVLIVLAIVGGVTYLVVSSARRRRALERASRALQEPADPGSAPPADR